jgi:hypothetical protein
MILSMYYHRNQAPFIAKKNRIAREFKLAIYNDSHETFKQLLEHYPEHFDKDIMEEVAKSPLMEFVHLVILSQHRHYIFYCSSYHYVLRYNKNFINCILQGHITTFYGTG